MRIDVVGRHHGADQGAIYQSNFLPIWKWRDYLPGWIKATSPFTGGP
jgi:hypothetical protein